MTIPKQVKKAIKILKNAKFEANIVGGCVRDFLLGLHPKDWDIATNAKPEQIQELFKKAIYNNNFGTVAVILNKMEIEITTYRIEEKYSDKRHPDKVEFADSLEQDLSRRDFTINAIARDQEIIDPYSGQKDIKDKLIRAVGNAEERFQEDPLRMMRAVRFSTRLDFKIEKKTEQAIKKHSQLLRFIARERIKDELSMIIMGKNPDQGILLLNKLGLLQYIIPELTHGIGMEQPRHHIYTVFKHGILSLKCCRSKKLSVLLASLFHDIAKPYTKRGKGESATFYNHDIVGARVAKKILQKLRFGQKTANHVYLLIRNHMFVYNVDEVTEAGVRRLIKRVGLENIKDLMDLRIADRLGSGCPKAKPYKLRHLEYLVHKVSRDPVSRAMLKISGDDFRDILKIKPGPKYKFLLEALLNEVLEDPKKNTKKYLLTRTKELNKLNQKELAKLSEQAQEKKQEIECKEKKWFRVS
ncbi:hypothetical protein CL633_03345 [bacterium]|nr:hypothetical protein [bacterium]